MGYFKNMGRGDVCCTSCEDTSPCCSCPAPSIEWDSRSASKLKCGFNDPAEKYVAGEPINRYLVKEYCSGSLSRKKDTITVDETRGCTTETTDLGCALGCGQGTLFFDAGKYYTTRVFTQTQSGSRSGVCFTESGSYLSVQTTVIGCSGVETTFSGNASYDYEFFGGEGCGGQPGGGTSCSSTQASDGSWSGTDDGFPTDSSCHMPPGSTDSVTTVYSNEVTILSNEYSSPYTTETLIATTLAALPAFDDDWNDTASSFFNLTTDELANSIREAKYRFRFKPTSLTCYRLEWIERFTPEAGDPIDTPKSWQWDGTIPGGYDPDDTATWPTSPEYIVAIPETNGNTTVFEINAFCTGCT